MDHSLGTDVQQDGYFGPTINGKPMHSGNCTDGVYGCRACRNTIQSMTFEEQQAFDKEEHRPMAPANLLRHCDYCKNMVERVFSIRPSDEGGTVEYMVCKPCNERHQAWERQEYAREFGKNDQDSYGLYDGHTEPVDRDPNW